MLQLTEAAGSHLHKSLAKARLPDHEGKCFRVVPSDEEKLTLRLAKPAPSDAIFKYDGTVVLALPEALRPYLKDKSLGIDDSGHLKLQ